MSKSNTINEVKKLQTGKVMIEGGFRDAYESLQLKDVKVVRELICNTCYWSYQTFIKRIDGNRPFRIYEVQSIEKIFKKKGIVAFESSLIKN